MRWVSELSDIISYSVFLWIDSFGTYLKSYKWREELGMKGVEGELEVFDFVHSVLLAVSVHPCRDNT